MKAIASLSLLGLAYGSEDNELFRPTTFRPVHTSRKFNTTVTNNVIHHNKHVETHSISNHLNENAFQAYSSNHLDDEEFFLLEDLPENELANFFGKFGSLIKSKNSTKTSKKVASNSFDDEFFPIRIKNNTKSAKKELSHSFDDEFFPIRIKNNTYPIYYEDEELFETNIQRAENSHNAAKGINKMMNLKIENETHDSVGSLEELIKEGVSIYKEVKTKKYVDDLNHEIQGLKKMLNDEDVYFTLEEVNDDDLFQVCINFRGGKICHNK